VNAPKRGKSFEKKTTPKGNMLEFLSKLVRAPGTQGESVGCDGVPEKKMWKCHLMGVMSPLGRGVCTIVW